MKTTTRAAAAARKRKRTGEEILLPSSMLSSLCVCVESGEIDELFLFFLVYRKQANNSKLLFLVCSTQQPFPDKKHCRQINTTSRHHGEYKFPIFFFFFFSLFLEPLFAVSIDHRVLSQRASFFLIIIIHQPPPETDKFALLECAHTHTHDRLVRAVLLD